MAGRKTKAKAKTGRRLGRRRTKLGAPPGTLHEDPSAPDAQVRVFFYGPESLEQHGTSVAGLAALGRRGAVTWVDIVGVEDGDDVRVVGDLFGLHALALEDVTNGGQRPKLEDYEGYLFIVTRIVHPGGGGQLDTEQISLFVGDDFVVSFQERAGDCFDPVRERLISDRGRIRRCGADYLVYALLDAVTDHYSPVIDGYSDRLEELEERVLADAGSEVVATLFEIRRELHTLKRITVASRDKLDRMHSGRRVGEDPIIRAETRTYLRDCHDHAVRVVEAIDSAREYCAHLMDLHYARAGQQLNEVMKVLTIISTIFIPLSFIAGLYGMNFERASPYNMPELGWTLGYPFALALMFVVVVAQLVYFRRKGWLGRGSS